MNEEMFEDQHSFEEIHQWAHEQLVLSSNNVSVSLQDRFIVAFKNQVFGPLGVAMCFCGVALNLVSYKILRKKEILITGNVPLMAISVCYMTVSLALLPLLLAMYCVTPPSAPKDKRNTFANMLLSVVSNQIQLTAHTVALWLGVFMALQRLVCINSRTPIKQNRFLSKRVTQFCIGLIVLLVICTSLPSYVISELRPRPTHFNQSIYEHLLCRYVARNSTNEWLTILEQNMSTGNPEEKTLVCGTVRHKIELPSSCVYYTVYVSSYLQPIVQLIHIIPQKVLPCVLMIILSVALVHSMRRVVHQSRKLARKRNQLQHSAADTCEEVDSSSEEAHDERGKRPQNSARSTDRLSKVNRTMTTMLIAIIIMMVATQLPPVIILYVSFYQYKRFGDFFDLLSLLNNMASFVLYCKMSATFRKEFARQFQCCCKTEEQCQEKQLACKKVHTAASVV